MYFLLCFESYFIWKIYWNFSFQFVRNDTAIKIKNDSRLKSVSPSCSNASVKGFPLNQCDSNQLLDISSSGSDTQASENESSSSSNKSRKSQSCDQMQRRGISSPKFWQISPQCEHVRCYSLNFNKMTVLFMEIIILQPNILYLLGIASFPTTWKSPIFLIVVVFFSLVEQTMMWHIAGRSEKISR